MFLSQLTARLLATRNPDGGWGYYPGRVSRLEPTSLALLALTATAAPPHPRIPASPFVPWLAKDGLLVDPNTDAPNLAFNAQAALALLALGDVADARLLTESLLAIKGITTGQTDLVRQDNSLAAWPWRDGTVSWAEPTAWCLLAVKRASGGTRSARARERIDVAERMLADRMCVGGGWNYGNTVVFGQALPAHLAVTALVLLALADRPDMPAVTASLQYLDERRLAERAGLTLALVRLALARFGQPVADLDKALAEVWEATGFLDNVPAAALAALSLSDAGQWLDPSHA